MGVGPAVQTALSSVPHLLEPCERPFRQPWAACKGSQKGCVERWNEMTCAHLSAAWYQRACARHLFTDPSALMKCAYSHVSDFQTKKNFQNGVKRERDRGRQREWERKKVRHAHAFALRQTGGTEMNDIQIAVSARENQRSVKNQIER